MLYLGWILAAFLSGALLAGLLLTRRKRQSVRSGLSAIDTFMGKSYAQVLAIARTTPQATDRTANGQVLRTWFDGDYSISLLFDAQDICLGVQDERIR